ncbi:putative XRE-type DNA-binding protein [Sphingobium wenxiniae]|jgi:predicted XRE-type DNA-binding protein|uniref:HTH cro/C1-type domain-containing protein n=1 Tax=Sphingobium wenxiniae (strain DSM 21828 / CGMCC 1.7748 / JZ-1) TaxID=595605 RepID=A0A562K837_SPHWJ|nr:helix-turn-helix transcriptional regulator [Sphingobium wenxiniae]MBB6193134.1 putative XRE-type DNA-binding protein [Sphingobium wenxiniae]MBE5074977.1 helix-turn-helix domain-containing protein [Erythrobacteraceae bacterium E2-1 Yellow Sea]TWH91580.1 hypothetical protein IQ35_03093 [Sphingobium wenxiniae]
MANNDQRDTASYRNLAEQISQRMSEAGMSSDQLAASANIEFDRLTMIMSGSARDVTITEVVHIAAALGTQVSNLFLPF